ncbi:MAG: DUF6776 family protein [Gammaproteobacteria bacterium]|nr:hypothetical protein [Gammaproteobacteria bacterium]
MSKVPEPLVLSFRPSRRIRVVVAAVLVLALAGTGWALFDYGRLRAGFDGATARQERAQSLERILQLQKDNDVLREQLAMAQRSRQVDREAYDEVKGSLKGLQDQVLELKQDLAFYRTVVGPRAGKVGLRIQSLMVSRTGDPSIYRYQLVLSQVLKRDQWAQGGVTLEVDGRQGGTPGRLSLKDLEVDRKAPTLVFRFKYFQRLQGRLRLPPRFTPRSVLVRVRVETPTRGVIEKTFQWPGTAEERSDVGYEQRQASEPGPDRYPGGPADRGPRRRAV